jgi:hypothetical protein
MTEIPAGAQESHDRHAEARRLAREFFEGIRALIALAPEEQRTLLLVAADEMHDQFGKLAEEFTHALNRETDFREGLAMPPRRPR